MMRQRHAEGLHFLKLMLTEEKGYMYHVGMSILFAPFSMNDNQIA